MNVCFLPVLMEVLATTKYLVTLAFAYRVTRHVIVKRTSMSVHQVGFELGMEV